jgi:hypothetical protein
VYSKLSGCYKAVKRVYKCKSRYGYACQGEAWHYTQQNSHDDDDDDDRQCAYKNRLTIVAVDKQ